MYTDLILYDIPQKQAIAKLYPIASIRDYFTYGEEELEILWRFAKPAYQLWLISRLVGAQDRSDVKPLFGLIGNWLEQSKSYCRKGVLQQVITCYQDGNIPLRSIRTVVTDSKFLFEKEIGDYIHHPQPRFVRSIFVDACAILKYYTRKEDVVFGLAVYEFANGLEQLQNLDTSKTSFQIAYDLRKEIGVVFPYEWIVGHLREIP